MLTTRTTIHVNVKMDPTAFFFYHEKIAFGHTYADAVKHSREAESFVGPDGKVDLHVVYNGDDMNHAIRCEKRLKEMVELYERQYKEQDSNGA